MNDLLNIIKNSYQNSDDLIIRKLISKENTAIYIMFFESISDTDAIYEYIIKKLINTTKIKNIYNILAGPKIKEPIDLKEIKYFLENSYAIVLYKDKVYAIEVKAELDRGITPSQTEPNMYGPKDSFCENYQKNLGLIKRRIKSEKLIVTSMESGNHTKTKISILHLNDIKLNKISKNLKSVIENANLDIIDSNNLYNILSRKSLFPTISKTEKPALACKFLLQGKLIILIDNSPFVLILNAKLKDFVNPSTTDLFIKVLRYVCLFLTIFTPAIYIALINFNQETIPPPLLISFSEQRSGVPFPAAIEAFIMLFICELLRETDIRFPSAYGSSASILGALILGDAAVSAGIVSPIMIIIIAITFITNLIFTEIQFVRAIRISRFINLLISSFLGLYGLNITIILTIAFMVNTKLYDGEYI